MPPKDIVRYDLARSGLPWCTMSLPDAPQDIVRDDLSDFIPRVALLDVCLNILYHSRR